jgi:dTDP-4-dehydrorhamnose reductase
MLLEAAWERYRLPVAFTEVHLGCTREEQLRWLLQAWDAAKSLRAKGGDARAITVWSLLGAFDWNSLVTKEANFYEPGVFDVRGPKPRPTALAHMTRALATEGHFDHPAVSGPGWWTRPERFFYPPVNTGQPRPVVVNQDTDTRPLLIVGATGTLGRAFARLCKVRGLAHHLLSRKDMDIASEASVEAAFERWRPWAVINAAGFVRVDDAESDPARCFRENTLGPTVLAHACRRWSARLMTFSSDLVFDGTRTTPYLESHATAPLNAYGWSKAEAERVVLETLPSSLVVRTGAFFGPWDPYNFVTIALGALSRGEFFQAADDVTVSPTYVPDLVTACMDLLIDGVEGMVHLVNQGQVTWAELARWAAGLAELDTGLVVGRPIHALGLPARRPRFSALGSERGSPMPSLDNALTRFLTEREDLETKAETGATRVACGICGGTHESDGNGRCGLHRERGDGGVAADR